MTQRRKKPTKRSISACVHDEKSRIWVIVVWDASAKIKHIGMRRQKLWPVISLSRSLARSQSFPSSVHTHTHTQISMRAQVCVCVYIYMFVCLCTVFGRHCSRAPGYTSRPLIYYTTYLSRAHLLSALALLVQDTHARGLPPSLTSRTKDDTSGGGGGSSRRVFHECATRTCHVHAHKHDDDL